MIGDQSHVMMVQPQYISNNGRQTEKKLKHIPVRILGIIQVVLGVLIAILGIAFIWYGGRKGFSKFGGLGLCGLLVGSWIVFGGAIAIVSSTSPGRRCYIATNLAFSITTCVFVVANIAVAIISVLFVDVNCYDVFFKLEYCPTDQFSGQLIAWSNVALSVIEFFVALMTSVFCCCFYACGDQ